MRIGLAVGVRDVDAGPQRVGGRQARHRYRRHRLAAGRHGAGPDDEHPGLALFYAGMVRKKNVLATAVQAFAVTALVTLVWFIVGIFAAFTDGGRSTARSARCRALSAPACGQRPCLGAKTVPETSS